MSFKIGGRFSMTINGVLQFTGPTSSFGISGPSNETVATSNGRHAFTSQEMPGFIEVEILVRRDENLDQLNRIESAAVELTLANGRVVSGTGMTRIGEPLQFDAVAGTTTLRLEGEVIDAG